MAGTQPILRRDSRAKDMLNRQKDWETTSFSRDAEKGQRLGYILIHMAKSKGLKTGASEVIEDALVSAYNNGTLAEILGKKDADELAKWAYPQFFATKPKRSRKKKQGTPALEGTA